MQGSSGPPLSVAVAADGAATVVSLSGELDLATSAQLRPQLRDVVRRQPSLLVLDLADLTFLDASGVSALVEAQRALARAGGTVVLRRPSRLVRKVVRLLDLQSVLPEEG